MPAMEEVFGMDHLREKILRYSIFNNTTEKISKKLVTNLRLVFNKTWLHTTTKLLDEFHIPLITLTLGDVGSVGDKSDSEDPSKLKGNRLDQLVETFKGSTSLPESHLPIKLSLKPEFFLEANYQSLANFLTKLGTNLIALSLKYPGRFGGTMPVAFPPFTLPQLQMLSFHFFDEEEYDDDFCTSKGFWLLHSLLNASKNLKALSCPFSISPFVIPADFNRLHLPPTLSYLDLGTKLKAKDLQVLFNNRLPNLTHLKLFLDYIPFEADFLFKILDRFQATLVSFEIDGLCCDGDGDPTPHTLLRFPVAMEKLKLVSIATSQCELDDLSPSPLQMCLPELQSISLDNQPEVSLMKWLRNSKFEKVQELDFAVVREELAVDHEDYYVSPRFEILSQVRHHTFPNLVVMSLHVNIGDLGGLEWMLRNMVKLVKLTIRLEGNEAMLENRSDVIITSLFLGLPVSIVEEAWKTDRDMEELERVLGKEGGEQPPAIRNLKELVCLTWWTRKERDAVNHCADQEGEVEQRSQKRRRRVLMADLLFRHAFMKMDNLWHLGLDNKFQPSLEVRKEWEAQSDGRHIHEL